MFESIWAALPMPAFVITDDTVTQTNVAAENFTKTSARQMQKTPLKQLMGQGSALLDAIQQAQNSMNSVMLHDVNIGWMGEARGLCNVQVNRLEAPEKTVLLLLHPRGIAEQMDRSLSHRNAARSVTGMAAMLAHEIRNPLAGISGAAQLLAMNLNQSDQELTDLILDETQRIGNLVNRVEMFGDARPIATQGVNIHDVLDRAKRAALAGFASHMRFVELYDPSLPLVAADADLLMQVFQNLMKNAAEASTKDGVITLKTAYRPGVKMAQPGQRPTSLPIGVNVSDNGSGVAQNLISDIFDPFVSSKANGSGLGLSLVSKIIADHGGVIECQNSDQGASFQILLPVWQGEAA